MYFDEIDRRQVRKITKLYCFGRSVNKIFSLCTFDYTAIVVSGEVGIPLTGLTTPFGWLSLIQITCLGRSAIAV